jgi:hypothetical protein
MDGWTCSTHENIKYVHYWNGKSDVHLEHLSIDCRGI